MQYANLIASHMQGNRPFTPGAGPNGGDFFLPWRMLRERFLAAGYEINTPDVNHGHDVDFELHLNAQRRIPPRPCYAFLYEDALVRPLNGDAARLMRYRKVFTWNENLIDGARFVRLDYPNDLAPRAVASFDERDLFCVLIASNKALRYPDPRSLHDKRVEAIRHFERHDAASFSLYGPGWDIPAVRPGAWGRLVKRVAQWRSRAGGTPRPFPSWRGVLPHKRDALDRARFCICYENSRGSPGYISEKLFDCLTSGCVAVYIGSRHRTPPVPAECYIDGDRFASPAELQRFLHAVTREDFARYQQAMREFVASPASRRFSNEHFCDTLVREITADLSASAAARHDAATAS